MVVDPHRTGMAFPGEVDLNEIGGDDQVLEISGGLVLLHRDRPEPLVVLLAVGHVVAGQDLFGDVRNRERSESSSDVPADIPNLKTTSHNRVEGCARNHSKMSCL